MKKKKTQKKKNQKTYRRPGPVRGQLPSPLRRVRGQQVPQRLVVHLDVARLEPVLPPGHPLPPRRLQDRGDGARDDARAVGVPS